MVCIPKEQGGLGVLNLRTQNECLLLKHLHKFYNRANVPWMQLVWDRYYPDGKLQRFITNFKGSLWWRDLLKLLGSYKRMAMATIHSGSSCFFWLDLWGGQVLQHTFLELFSFCRDNNVTVQKMKSTATIISSFHLPLFTEAYEQFQQLGILIQNLQLTTDPDQWSYIWGSMRANRALIGSSQVHQVL